MKDKQTAAAGLLESGRSGDLANSRRQVLEGELQAQLDLARRIDGALN